MPVQMARKPGTGGLSLVEPDIVTLGLEHPIENGDHPLNRFDRFEQVRALELAECSTMRSRSDEQMPVIVRITIQNNEGIRAPLDDQVFAVVDRSPTPT